MLRGRGEQGKLEVMTVRRAEGGSKKCRTLSVVCGAGGGGGEVWEVHSGGVGAGGDTAAI